MAASHKGAISFGLVHIPVARRLRARILSKVLNMIGINMLSSTMKNLSAF